MHGFRRVKDHRRRAGAGQSRSDLGTDVETFPNAGNDDLSALRQRREYFFHCVGEGVAEAVAHLRKTLHLDIDHLTGALNIIHKNSPGCLKA